MKTAYINAKAHEIVDLNKLILDHSVELDNIYALDKLIDKIGEAKYVLLGEASHGTHEYYIWRTHISKRLIEEKGFSFIAVEGDWPDCYRINRYIKNYPDAGETAYNVLHAFNRWPTWMWANWEIVALTEWLRGYNEKKSKKNKVGFYGLDVYSLGESLEAVVQYLDKEDPKTKHSALNVMKCFEPYKEGEGQSYAQATRSEKTLCEEEVLNLLFTIQKNMAGYNSDPESVMSVEQNAQTIVNAERYYRAMMRSGPDSWNIRDQHMVETLNRLMKFYGPKAKGIIWEHNTHIGDARATDMTQEGTINVGQLLNQQHEKEGVFSVGFGSYKGTVVAGRDWGDVMRIMNVPEAIPNSWEYLLHQLSAKSRIVFMSEEIKKIIGSKKIGHRAIGVVYRPQYEHLGNYVSSLIPYRYNAFFYLDETTALHPLHITPDGHQTPVTFPFGV